MSGMPAPADSRRIDEEAALRAVVEGTASETGVEFYRALVENLSHVLDTRGAWVTEYDEKTERLRALAFKFGNNWVEDFEYSIVGTACETAIREKRLVHIPDRVVDLYPRDTDPNMPGIVSYLGVPILDRGDKIIGHLAVVDTRPMPEQKRLVPLFQIFASRAAAEMRRLHLESAVREREEKLTRLIDGAMDAIVELDRNLEITMMNTAAEKLFGCSSARVRGQRVEHLIGVDATRELTTFAEELDHRTSGDRHIWIPGILTPRPPGQEPFLAEATLSRYEAHGRPFFTMILRNVTERVNAELRIETLSAQTEYLRAEIEEDHGFDEIVGRSASLRAALQAVAQVAHTDATVLIQGETGTGKELFARAIHKRSLRREGPLIKVNCAAIPATLIESEFFGHEKGAFTGATQRRDGRFALAHGGTIFLDEIGELPLELQGKLLRVLQEGEFEPVGGSKTRRVNVRVIAATNRDLDRAVREGTFREDLYYRLSVFPLRLPPLREREDDVVIIANNLIAKLARSMGSKAGPLPDDAAAAFTSYPWPGNVRELRNVIERALITSGGGPLNLQRVLPDVSPLPAPARAPEAAPAIMDERRLRRMERDNMIAALEQAGWRVGGDNGAASLIGVSPSTFKSRMKALDIRRPD
ncbi:MAG TPA: sigma 54-interacting transcriptional regulator [Candidatus Krumholzibacteria bacterium]|nr:sigma 54-interacting transcriptional regulator [Candidatus Krumholzibacteria bacterium]